MPQSHFLALVPAAGRAIRFNALAKKLGKSMKELLPVARRLVDSGRIHRRRFDKLGVFFSQGPISDDAVMVTAEGQPIGPIAEFKRWPTGKPYYPFGERHAHVAEGASKEARQRKRSPSLSKLERACRAAVAECVRLGCSAAEIRAAVERGCRGVG